VEGVVCYLHFVVGCCLLFLVLRLLGVVRLLMAVGICLSAILFCYVVWVVIMVPGSF